MHDREIPFYAYELSTECDFVFHNHTALFLLSHDSRFARIETAGFVLTEFAHNYRLCEENEWIESELEAWESEAIKQEKKYIEFNTVIARCLSHDFALPV